PPATEYNRAMTGSLNVADFRFEDCENDRLRKPIYGGLLLRYAHRSCCPAGDLAVRRRTRAKRYVRSDSRITTRLREFTPEPVRKAPQEASTGGAYSATRLRYRSHRSRSPAL